MRNNWRDYLLTVDEAEEKENAYIVFEEYEDDKNYDLGFGIFSELYVAKEYAESLNKYADEKNKKYVAKYKDYVNGSYNYL